MSSMDDAFPKIPSQVREERMIILLEQLNKNLAIVGAALLRLHEPKPSTSLLNPNPPSLLKVKKKDKVKL